MKENKNMKYGLPIGLPNDPDLLKEMIYWEKKFGTTDMVKIMENKLKQIEKKNENKN